MNYAEAKEIVESFKQEHPSYLLPLESRAEGYLEAFSLAERLAEALDVVYGVLPGRVTDGARKRVDEALAEFEKAKGNHGR